MATLADLLPQIYARVEEDPSNPLFWIANESTTAAVEAINDLMMLVGRPTQTVDFGFDIVPYTPWQTVPAGIFCLTDIQGAASQVWKYTLHDLDYLQVSWGSDWEDDVGDVILHWAPIGLTKFVVHPCVPVPQHVRLTGISYTTTETWPYDTNISIPYPDQFLQTLEKYAAHYLRLKEGGDEFTESYKLLQSYMADAQRFTEIEDRMDPLIFATGTGIPMAVNPTTKR